METNESKIGRIADHISQQKLENFTRILRRNLVEAGVAGEVIDNAVQTTSLALEIEESNQSIIDQVLLTYENRGMDSVGRIVVEFCFIRSEQGRMIWPEYSDEDTMARWQFTDNVLPRPLMRYFLVSVRGTVDEIDGFTTGSFLFNDNPDGIEAIRNQISDLIDEFKGPFGSGESSVDWQAVYDDPRFQKFALELIRSMRLKLEQEGLEEYLLKLENYRSLDPRHDENNLMQRQLTMEDAKQISQALRSAEKALNRLTD